MGRRAFSRPLLLGLLPGLLASASASAQLFPQSEPPAEPFLRPASAEAIPAGGLVAASLSRDVEHGALEEVTLTDDEGELIVPLFESCVRGTRWCIYRSRFPLGRPVGNVFDVELEATGDIVGLTVDGPYASSREADTTPPQGLDTLNLSIQSLPGGFGRPQTTYALTVTAPELSDDRGIVLLELFDVTEGDRDLIGHAVFDDGATTYGLQAPIDIPEPDERCYRLEATDLGGNTAASERRCLDVAPAGGCSHTKTPRSPAAAGLALLGLLVLLRRRRR